MRMPVVFLGCTILLSGITGCHATQHKTSSSTLKEKCSTESTFDTNKYLALSMSWGNYFIPNNFGEITVLEPDEIGFKVDGDTFLNFYNDRDLEANDKRLFKLYPLNLWNFVDLKQLSDWQPQCTTENHCNLTDDLDREFNKTNLSRHWSQWFTGFHPLADIVPPKSLGMIYRSHEENQIAFIFTSQKLQFNELKNTHVNFVAQHSDGLKISLISKIQNDSFNFTAPIKLEKLTESIFTKFIKCS